MDGGRYVRRHCGRAVTRNVILLPSTTSGMRRTMQVVPARPWALNKYFEGLLRQATWALPHAKAFRDFACMQCCSISRTRHARRRRSGCRATSQPRAPLLHRCHTHIVALSAHSSSSHGSSSRRCNSGRFPSVKSSITPVGSHALKACITRSPYEVATIGTHDNLYHMIKCIVISCKPDWHHALHTSFDLHPMRHHRTCLSVLSNIVVRLHLPCSDELTVERVRIRCVSCMDRRPLFERRNEYACSSLLAHPDRKSAVRDENAVDRDRTPTLNARNHRRSGELNVHRPRSDDLDLVGMPLSLEENRALHCHHDPDMPAHVDHREVDDGVTSEQPVFGARSEVLVCVALPENVGDRRRGPAEVRDVKSACKPSVDSYTAREGAAAHEQRPHPRVSVWDC